MPRFFFHIVDDDTRSPDEEGLELSDLAMAKMECETSARELLIQDLKARREVDNRRIEVMDAAGNVVQVCHLRDLVN